MKIEVKLELEVGDNTAFPTVMKSKTLQIILNFNDLFLQFINHILLIFNFLL